MDTHIFNQRAFSLASSTLVYFDMAATLGVMVAGSVFNAAKSAVSEEVKKQVGEALMRQPQVQRFRKSLDTVRGRLVDRVRRGRKAISTAASSVSEAQQGHASVAGECDVGRLQDLVDFEDVWSDVKHDNEMTRMEYELEAGHEQHEHRPGVVRSRTVALQLTEEVRSSLEAMVARPRGSADFQVGEAEGAPSRAGSDEDEDGYASGRSSPEHSSGASGGERRAKFGGVERVRVPRRMSTQEASMVSENRKLQESILRGQREIEQLKVEFEKTRKKIESNHKKELFEMSVKAMEWQYWARCYGYEDGELLRREASKVWARKQLRESSDVLSCAIPPVGHERLFRDPCTGAVYYASDIKPQWVMVPPTVDPHPDRRLQSRVVYLTTDRLEGPFGATAATRPVIVPVHRVPVLGRPTRVTVPPNQRRPAMKTIEMGQWVRLEGIWHKVFVVVSNVPQRGVELCPVAYGMFGRHSSRSLPIPDFDRSRLPLMPLWTRSSAFYGPQDPFEDYAIYNNTVISALPEYHQWEKMPTTMSSTSVSFTTFTEARAHWGSVEEAAAMYQIILETGTRADVMIAFDAELSDRARMKCGDKSRLRFRRGEIGGSETQDCESAQFILELSEYVRHHNTTCTEPRHSGGDAAAGAVGPVIVGRHGRWIHSVIHMSRSFRVADEMAKLTDRRLISTDGSVVTHPRVMNFEETSGMDVNWTRVFHREWRGRSAGQSRMDSDDQCEEHYTIMTVTRILGASKTVEPF